MDDTYDEMQHPMDFRNDLPWRTIKFPSGEVKTFEEMAAYMNLVEYYLIGKRKARRKCRAFPYIAHA